MVDTRKEYIREQIRIARLRLRHQQKLRRDADKQAKLEMRLIMELREEIKE